MSTFDDCTIGEIEMVQAECLGGIGMSDPRVDPMMVAAGVMWIIKRRDNPTMDWVTFKNTTRMSDIKAFSAEMEALELDPTVRASSSAI